MQLTMDRQEIINKLLNGYQRHYNIHKTDTSQKPLIARCDYFEHSERYVLSRKAELWSADCEEFLYLFDVPHLTLEKYEQCMRMASEDGMGRMNIGPGHMYSYITAIIISDSADENAVRTLKKSRIHKSFHFSLHGWMDYRAVAVMIQSNHIQFNSAGRCVAKTLKKVLYSTKKGGKSV